MKFKIQRDLLMKALQDVMKAIPSRTTIPVLTGLKVTISQEGLTLTGSDSDISIESYIPAIKDDIEQIVVEEAGATVLQARYFNEIIRKAPEEYVYISTNEKYQTTIESGSAKFKLNGFDAKEYPLLPQITEDNMFQVQTDLLKTVIQQTVFAIATSEIRPILTGVKFEIKGKEISCTATDSHRLAYRQATIQVNGAKDDLDFNIVVPGKSLNELNKILEDTDELLEIIVADNQILFKTENLLFYSRLLEGQYPETKRLIPTESVTDITVDTRSFYRMIDRASLMGQTDKNNVVKLSTNEDQSIEVSSNTPEVGYVNEQLQCIAVEGEQLNISFSAKYMLDALRVIDSTNIKISFAGPMRPFIIKSENDDSIIQLILPVRTS